MRYTKHYNTTRTASDRELTLLLMYLVIVLETRTILTISFTKAYLTQIKVF